MPKAKVVQTRVFVVLLTIAVCLTAPLRGVRGGGKLDPRIEALWDAQRYIGVDEVKPGMDAYCLTDYGTGGIEKFGLKILKVVRDIEPGRNAILVVGTDDRFTHTGPVAGCSGSPVYIDGRLAGALAYAWTFSKDPLYRVTPIQEMLAVGLMDGSRAPAASSGTAAFTFDFSRPIQVAQAAEQLVPARLLSGSSADGASSLPCPLLISGLSAEACRYMAGQLETMGFMAMPGLGGSATGTKDGSAQLVPGGTLTMPLVTGDIRMNVLGTITEVRDGCIYGFGHSFLGYGATSLPMAGGEVYTVVSSVQRSSKLGTSTDIVGTITVDAEGAVFGRLGTQPEMIPVRMQIERSDMGGPHTYTCRVARNKLLTAALVRSALAGAGFQAGSFPPEHCVEYHAAIDLDDGRSVRFANTSTNMDLAEPGAEIAGVLNLLMNNPFGGAAVREIEFGMRMTPKNIDSYIWSVNVSDSKVKPGQEIQADVVIESYLKEKRRHQISIQVPEHLAPGKYNLMLLGSREYESFLRKSIPFRFMATNFQTLVDALNAVLNVSRTKLYCLLVLPPDGIMLEKAELPKLPRTKALVLQSEKRAVAAIPYAQWIEKVVETGTIIADKEAVAITVEK